MQHHVFTIAKVCESYGIKDVIICPGSRSAPLVFAFTRNPYFNCLSAVDERSAAFIAMGMAQQMQQPVVLICTSGTAVLNFFPAVAEAYYQKIPLLILSADRPPELLNQQDGQMIMQKGVFGKHILGSHELLCYEEDKIDYKLTERIVKQAILESMADSGKGPVHINVPLREPLYDVPEVISIPSIHVPKPIPKEDTAIPLPHFEEFTQAWTNSTKKLILIGNLAPSAALNDILKKLAANNELIVISDICANQQMGCKVPHFDFALKLKGSDLHHELNPDFILSLGGPLVSKSLNQWLKRIKVPYHFRLQGKNENIDTYNNLTHLLVTDELDYLETFCSLHPRSKDNNSAYIKGWETLNTQTEKIVSSFHFKKTWCEPSAVAHLLAHIPEGSLLHSGNSSAIRWLSWNGIPQQQIAIFCNRGTSGIDGCLSTAVGAAIAQPEQNVFIILGDLSFIYDEHALWFKPLPENLKIIVLNNQSGNIFNWINGPSEHPNELPFFTTRQERDLGSIAASYQIKHIMINNFDSLTAYFNKWEKGLEIVELSFENNNGLNSFLSLALK